MISIDSIESVNTKRKSHAPPRAKGRLVRSLEFTDTTSSTNKRSNNSRRCRTRPITKSSISMWRDPLKNVLPTSNGFTTHKMSSVTNNFLSSDSHSNDPTSASSSSEIDEMVEELVDPGSGTLVFAQHDEVFRSSPLSNSSFTTEIDGIDEFDTNADNTNNNNPNNNILHNFITYNLDTNNENNFGMSWNPKQNKWVPLIYRYVFPSSTFDTSTIGNFCLANKTNWTLKNGQITTTVTAINSSSSSCASFTFPPPQKSIMMGPVKLDSDARDVCEKLLELIDDENLMLPAVKSSQPSSSPQKQHQIIPSVAAGNKILLSEWSSLPSSPPPPIFHDVCNRPIPELRLSPPMTGKSIGKRLFPTNSVTTTVKSPCESPLTKRLRFSSSSSSIA
jgi:hypothetical protein